MEKPANREPPPIFSRGQRFSEAVSVLYRLVLDLRT